MENKSKAARMAGGQEKTSYSQAVTSQDLEEAVMGLTCSKRFRLQIRLVHVTHMSKRTVF